MLFSVSDSNLHCLKFCFLFTATCFVNKYVLSVLRFTHPTVFQGWQTFVGVILIQIRIILGHIDPLFDGNSLQTMLLWFPELMLFVLSIYSGSKALANVSIPAFLAVINICLVIKRVSKCILHRNLMISDTTGWTLHFIIAGSVLGVMKTDPMFETDGYFWMCVHIACLSAILVFIEFNKDIVKLSNIKLLYYNYTFSVFSLAPCSFFLGDIFDAANFKYLYLYRFYIGCIASGIFGVLLNLLRIKLQEDSKFLVYNELLQVTQIITSILSIPLFQFTITVEHSLWIMITQLVALIVNVEWRKLDEIKPIEFNMDRNNVHKDES